MTVIDVKARARRLGVDIGVLRKANAHLNDLIVEAMRNKQDDHVFTVARKLKPDELAAIVRYREYDKKYPTMFDRNGFIEH